MKKIKALSKKKVQRLVLIVAALSMAAFATGCGASVSPGSGMVQAVALNTYTVGSDQWLEFSTLLNTNGFQMASINVPIADPNAPTVQYGTIGIASSLCSSNPCKYSVNINIALNLTQASLSHTLSPYLPNGTSVPIAGIDPAIIVSLPIVMSTVSNSRIYFAFDKVSGVAMLGAALTFSALDPVGHYVPGLNYFQPFSVNGVNMSAGIFAGSQTNTTGIGFFADISNIMPKSYTLRALELVGSAKAPKLQFKTVTPSNSKLYKLGTKLNALGKKGTVLSLD